MSLRIDPPVEHRHGTLVCVHFDTDLSLPADADRLLPEELAHMAGMGKFRLASWVAGRVALAEALTAVGAPRVPILPDDRGAPAPPEGFGASLSHKRHIAVALAAEADGDWRIGVDVEEIGQDRSRIAPRILTEAESSRIAQLPEADRWPSILAHFSIKEAIYKAVDPFVCRYVAFSEAELDAIPVGDGGLVQARLHVREGLFEVQATFSFGPPPIATARVRRG